MTLVRKSTLQSVSTDGKNIIVKETTGAYDASTNPGGFGTPNPDTTFFQLIILKLLYIDGSITYLATASASDFLGGSNYSINSGLLPSPADYPFKDGVLQVTSYASSTLVTVVGTAGNKFITGSLANFVAADAIVDSGNVVYLIDKTQTNTSGTIYLTTALLTTITQARVGYAASCYAMINAGFICKMVNAIGGTAESCNEDENALPLYDLLVKKFQADFAFAAGDYVNANRAIVIGDTQVNKLIDG